MLLELEPGSECNLNCIYCYRKKHQYISNVDFSLAKIKEYNPTGLVFIGGEPLIYFPFIEKITKETNLPYSITTNLTLLEPKMLEYFRKTKAKLLVSIDGKEETHNMQRSNSFNKVMSNLDTSFMKRVRMTITPKSIKNIFDNLKFLASLGFRKISAEIAKEYNGYDWDEYKDQLKKVKAWGRKSITDILDIKFSCSAGKTLKCLGADQKIYPCHRFIGLTTDYPEKNLTFGCPAISLLYNKSFSGLTPNSVKEQNIKAEVLTLP